MQTFVEYDEDIAELLGSVWQTQALPIQEEIVALFPSRREIRVNDSRGRILTSFSLDPTFLSKTFEEVVNSLEDRKISFMRAPRTKYLNYRSSFGRFNVQFSGNTRVFHSFILTHNDYTLDYMKSETNEACRLTFLNFNVDDWSRDTTIQDIRDLCS